MKASNAEMFIKQRQKELFDQIKKLNILKKMEKQYIEPELPAEFDVVPEKEIMPKPVDPDTQEVTEEKTKEVSKESTESTTNKVKTNNSSPKKSTKKEESKNTKTEKKPVKKTTKNGTK